MLQESTPDNCLGKHNSSLSLQELRCLAAEELKEQPHIGALQICALQSGFGTGQSTGTEIFPMAKSKTSVLMMPFAFDTLNHKGPAITSKGHSRKTAWHDSSFNCFPLAKGHHLHRVIHRGPYYCDSFSIFAWDHWERKQDTTDQKCADNAKVFAASSTTWKPQSWRTGPHSAWPCTATEQTNSPCCRELTVWIQTRDKWLQTWGVWGMILVSMTVGVGITAQEF